MKPPIATLRLDVHIISIYIDDLINVGLTLDEYVENVIALKSFWTHWGLLSIQTNLYSYQNRK